MPDGVFGARHSLRDEPADMSPFGAAGVEGTVVLTVVEVEVFEDLLVLVVCVDGTTAVVEVTILAVPDEGTGSTPTTIKATAVETSATIATPFSETGIFLISRRLCLNIVPISE